MQFLGERRGHVASMVIDSTFNKYMFLAFTVVGDMAIVVIIVKNLALGAATSQSADAGPCRH